MTKKYWEALIKADANKEARDKEGKTRLHLAAHYNNIEIIKSLVANLANREAKDKNGRTPLHMSILNNSRVLEESKGALKTLLDIGVDVDAQDNYGKTPLHYAATWNADSVESLLKNGANKKFKDKSGKTPYDLATDPEIQELLWPNS